MLGATVLLIIFLFLVSIVMSKYLVVNSNKPDIKPVRLKLDSGINFMTYDSLASYLRDTLHTDDTIFTIEKLDNISGKYVPFDRSEFEPMTWTSGFFTILMNEEDNVRADFLCIQGRSFSIYEGLPIGNEGLSLTIKEKGDATQGTGLNVWDGSIVLSKYLELHPELITGKTILELGAGTGVSGIAAGLLGARHVTLTDLEYTIRNLQINSDFNFQQIEDCVLLSKDECISTLSTDGEASEALPFSYSVGILDWSDPSTYLNDIRYDVILGADIVWLEYLVPLLQKALVAHMKPGTLLILSHQVSNCF